MSVHSIASRYAKSLMDLSSEQGKMETVLNDIKAFKASLASRDLYLLLKSPIINTPKKIKCFEALFGGKFDEMTSAFFNIILRKGREMYLPEITDEFITQYKDRKEISTVELTTARPLSDDDIEKIKNQLLDSNVTGKSIDLDVKVDKDLIGGFVIEMGDRLYDASVRHKLEQVKKDFLVNDYEKSL